MIGTNKKDAQDTVDTLLADLAAGPGTATPAEDRADQLAQWLASRQPQLVSAAHWQLIDRFEREAGAAQNRPRVKVASVPELLHIGGCQKGE
ncbi:NADPH-ferredoxin reductase fprA domain protein [Mycobacterium kansasii 732]|nr:NADPH-ferredoxin reductase fprA domain protein [Mycobacterium kansasii 732]